MTVETEIRSTPLEFCPLCGSPGVTIHTNQRDRIYQAPGVWGHRQCSGPRCGLIWLDPMPWPEDIGKAYETYYTHSEAPTITTSTAKRFQQVMAEGYVQSRFCYTHDVRPPWYRWLRPLAFVHPGGEADLAAWVLYLPAPRPGARLVEVGCGSGDMLLRMERLGWEAEGVEVDERAAEAARAKGLTVHLGELQSHRFPDTYADAVVLQHVLEHLHDPLGVLAEASRILRPGGSLIILTPNANSLGRRFFGSSWYPLDPPRHLMLYSVTSMRRALEAVPGLEILRLRSTVRYARSIWGFSRQIQRFGRAERLETSVVSQIIGLPYQQAQRLLQLVRNQAGDELLLIARKAAA